MNNEKDYDTGDKWIKLEKNTLKEMKLLRQDE
jgi:hypothetical protein